MLDAIIGNPIIFSSIVIIVSLFIILKAADLLVTGVSDYARKLGLSDSLSGLIIVSLAASMPEILASLTGLVSADPGVFFGTVLGNNLVHMGLLVGAIALFAGRAKISFESKLLEKSTLLIWFLLMLPFVLMSDGRLSRADGLVLLFAFAFYIIRIWRMEGSFGKIKRNVEFRHIWRDMFVFCGSLVAILLAVRLLVFGAVNIAHVLGIPSYFIALTIIGVGGTIDDFAISFRSIWRKHAAIGVGDAVGSVVNEFLLFFGLVGLIYPVDVPFNSLLNAVIFLVIGITITLYLVKKGKVNWKHGLLLLLVYAAFISIEIWKFY